MATSNSTANRELKNSVFTLLFGDIALKLYEAVTGKQYGPDVNVTDTTLTDVLYRGRLNDLSFELDGKFIVLIEHQSTLNENMPLRMLEYITRLYRRYTASNKIAIYSEKMITIPRPEFIVLYNGVKDMPGGDRQTLKLSDMFADAGQDIEPAMGGLELTVEVFNINKGRNPEMAARCPELDGYETFVQMVREYESSGMSRESAVNKAVLECIEKGILKEFLEQYRWEVIDMLVAEWDFDVELRVAKQESREEKALEIARSLKAKGVDMSTIVEATGITVDEVLRM